MNKLEESWLTFTEVVMPVIALGSYAAITFVIMTFHSEGRFRVVTTPEKQSSEASVVSIYSATGKSWSSLTTEGCADYTHPSPKDWSEYV